MICLWPIPLFVYITFSPTVSLSFSLVSFCLPLCLSLKWSRWDLGSACKNADFPCHYHLLIWECWSLIPEPRSARQPPAPFSSQWGTPQDIWITLLVPWGGQSTYFLVDVIVLDLEVLIFIPAPSPSGANYPWVSCRSLFDNANRTTLSAKSRDEDLGTISFMLCSTLPSQWVDWTMCNSDLLLLNDCTDLKRLNNMQHWAVLSFQELGTDPSRMELWIVILDMRWSWQVNSTTGLGILSQYLCVLILLSINSSVFVACSIPISKLHCHYGSLRFQQ